MSDLLLITTTSDDSDSLVAIARYLVEERLAACAQVGGPCKSYYFWDGKLTDSTEFSLTAKSTVLLFSEVVLAIKGLHSYTLPEIIATPILDCSSEYRNWVLSQLKSNP